MQNSLLANGALVLRDIHEPAAPSWWPPAPGWWLVAAAALLLGACVVWWRWRERRRRARIVAYFDDVLARADGDTARVVAISELLRRAARRHAPQADTAHGEAWLALLDADDADRPFTRGAGRLLLEGGFRRDVDAGAVAALQQLARARFVAWMGK